MTLDQDQTHEDNDEQHTLRTFGILGACFVGVLKIISLWFPSMDLAVRITALTLISFGTVIVLRRRELRRKATWTALIIGALIHCVVIWALRDRIVDVNMWVAGGCAGVEALLLQVSIEMCKPSAERWNS